MRKLFLDHALLPTGWGRDVAVDVEDGTIRAVSQQAAREGRERLAGLTLPGLPNLHSHTFQRGMAGLAETRGPGSDSFWTWRQAMYRFLGLLTPDDVEAIAVYAMVEMLERGFTAVGEFHYLHHDIDGAPYANRAELAGRIIAAAAQTGIGLTLLPVFYAQGGFGGAAPSEGQRRFVNSIDGYLRLVEDVQMAARGLDSAMVGIAPHSLRAVTPGSLASVLASATDAPIHIHVAEQTREVEDCLAWCGQRPVEWLLDHAPVDERWCLVHATHLDSREIRRLAQSGAVAGLCPITEANLGDGVFEGPAFLAAGGRFGLGTDSNIQIDAPAELRQLEYSQRLAQRARNVMAVAEGQSTGQSLYESALAGGAAALGRPVGAIAVGCRADLVVLDLDHPDLAAMPNDRWLDTYIFVAGASAVDTVLVGGATVVSDGRHLGREAAEEQFRRAMARLAS